MTIVHSKESQRQRVGDPDPETGISTSTTSTQPVSYPANPSRPAAPQRRPPAVDHTLMCITFTLGQVLNTPQTVTPDEALSTYNLIRTFSTPKDASQARARKLELYNHLMQYVRQHLRNVYREIIAKPHSCPDYDDYEGKRLTAVYVERWRRFRTAAQIHQRIFEWLEDDFIKPEVAEAMKDDDFCPMGIEEMHRELWIEQVLAPEVCKVTQVLVDAIYGPVVEGEAAEGSGGKGKSVLKAFPWERDEDLREVRDSLLVVGMLEGIE